MSSHGTNGRSPHTRNTAGLIWFAAILTIAGVVWLLLVVSGVAGVATSLTAVAWCLVLLSLGVNAWKRNRQHRRYRQRFPTIDALRRHVDADALRTVRDREGQKQAVKQLRRHVPEVPLTEAVRLIKSL